MSRDTRRRDVLKGLAVGGFTGLAGCGGGDGGSDTEPQQTETTPTESETQSQSGGETATTGSKESVKLGLAYVLSGDVYELLKAADLAFDMAVEEINAAGGIDVGGTMRKIEPVKADTECKTDVGRKATQKLVYDDEVDVLIGPWCSNAALAGIPIAGEAKVPQFPGGTNPKIISPEVRHKYMWHIRGTSEQRGLITSKWQVANFDKVAFIAQDSSYGKSAVDSYVKTLYPHWREQGGSIEVVSKQFYEEGSTRLRPQLSKIKAAEPDVVHMVATSTPSVVAITEQAQATGLRDVAQLTGETSWGNLSLRDKINQNALEGVIFNSPVNRTSSRDAVQNYLSNYKSKYGRLPSHPIGANAYDSVNVVKAIIEEAGTLNPDKISAAASTIETCGHVYGNGCWSFDENHQANVSLLLLRWTSKSGTMEWETVAGSPDDIEL